MIWHWEGTSVFVVQSTYHYFNDGGVHSKNARVIWSTKCPKKIRVFLWLVS